MALPRRLVALVAAAVVTCTVAGSTATAQQFTSNDPATLDPPDPYFPALGNTGYDVEHYDLALSTDDTKDSIDGTTTIEAKATDRLSRFNLDLTGFKVRSVQVDGKKAKFSRQGSELKIKPAKAIADDADFTVAVKYEGKPTTGEIESIGLQNGWLDLGDSVVTLNEPDAANRLFPSNDHPSDKASFTFHLTVPSDIAAVANGTLADKVVKGDETTWVWDETAPMATYLAQIGIGDFVVNERPGPGGVTIRDAIARSLQDQIADSPVALNDDMLTFFSSVYGPYPFDVYGLLIPDAPLGFGFEAQTLTLVGSDTLSNGESELAHEMTHQWLGDWVSPATWRDIWLNEGFATYGEWLWAEHANGVPLTDNVEDARRQVEGFTDVPTDDPGLDFMFGPNSYQRGALTLYALRQEVGNDTFLKIVRTYLERFGGKSATTADFTKVAGDVAGRDLGDFFDAWLDEGPLPPTPSGPTTA